MSEAMNEHAPADRPLLVYWIEVMATIPGLGVVSGKAFWDEAREPHAWLLPTGFPGGLWSTRDSAERIGRRIAKAFGNAGFEVTAHIRVSEVDDDPR